MSTELIAVCFMICTVQPEPIMSMVLNVKDNSQMDYNSI